MSFRFRMAKFSHVLVVVATGLFVVSASTQPSVEVAWAGAVLDSLQEVAGVAARLLPSITQIFLAAPDTALESLLQDRALEFTASFPSLALQLDTEGISGLEVGLAGVAREMGRSGDEAGEDEVTQRALELLAQFSLTESAKPPECFTKDGRYSGTDLRGSKIREGRAESTAACQEVCQDEPECEYFIYFRTDHYQPSKRRICRLLR